MHDETPLTADPAQTARLMRRATYASVFTATMLIVGKLVAALLTGSVSVLASLMDSMMDVAASIINLLAVHYSLQPPIASTGSVTARRNRWRGWCRRPSSPVRRCF